MSKANNWSDNSEREQFVKDLNGTSMEEVISFTSQIPLFVFFPLFIELCVLNRFNINVYKPGPLGIFNAVVVFILEVIAIVIPLVFMFTLLSDYLLFVFIATLVTKVFILIYSVSCPDDCVNYWQLPNFQRTHTIPNVPAGRQPFVTYFRSLVFLVTAISILGVDFHVYPRRFAKTETYGVSLMDLGVGLFVVSSALVVKKTTIIAQGFLKTLWGSSVFLVLGALRYFLIQRLDYQKHVTEYGVHWNFFITLGFVKLLSFLILKISKGHSLVSGLIVLLIHQYMLSISLESYVLSDIEREGWLNANREGLVSLPGYLSLYLIAIGFASIINPADKQQTIGSKVRTLLFIITAEAFLFFFSYYCNNTALKVSRRLANLSFVTWILSVSFSILTVSIISELLSLWFLPIQPRFKGKVYSLMTPALLESINYNGMLYFLISNFLTGLINLYFDVLNMETFSSVSIITTYMLVNCSIVYILYLKNKRLKF